MKRQALSRGQAAFALKIGLFLRAPLHHPPHWLYNARHFSIFTKTNSKVCIFYFQIQWIQSHVWFWRLLVSSKEASSLSMDLSPVLLGVTQKDPVQPFGVPVNWRCPRLPKEPKQCHKPRYQVWPCTGKLSLYLEPVSSAVSWRPPSTGQKPGGRSQGSSKMLGGGCSQKEAGHPSWPATQVS